MLILVILAVAGCGPETGGEGPPADASSWQVVLANCAQEGSGASREFALEVTLRPPSPLPAGMEMMSARNVSLIVTDGRGTELPVERRSSEGIDPAEAYAVIVGETEPPIDVGVRQAFVPVRYPLSLKADSVEELIGSTVTFLGGDASVIDVGSSEGYETVTLQVDARLIPSIGARTVGLQRASLSGGGSTEDARSISAGPGPNSTGIIQLGFDRFPPMGASVTLDLDEWRLFPASIRPAHLDRFAC